MRGVTYSYRKRITKRQLEDLFEGLPVSRRPPQTPRGIAEAGQVVSAWRNGALIGLAHGSASRNTVVLSWIYVHLSYRRRGIGLALVSRFLSRFSGCTKVKLVANRAALGFYRKCGFKVRRDAVPMIKVLRRNGSGR
jgi:GNAT superfamily N-acetyltransferase